jgi:hypothetical protein
VSRECVVKQPVLGAVTPWKVDGAGKRAKTSVFHHARRLLPRCQQTQTICCHRAERFNARAGATAAAGRCSLLGTRSLTDFYALFRTEPIAAYLARSRRLLADPADRRTGAARRTPLLQAGKTHRACMCHDLLRSHPLHPCATGRPPTC